MGLWRLLLSILRIRTRRPRSVAARFGRFRGGRKRGFVTPEPFVGTTLYQAVA
jgi:hypothetical protein